MLDLVISFLLSLSTQGNFDTGNDLSSVTELRGDGRVVSFASGATI